MPPQASHSIVEMNQMSEKHIIVVETKEDRETGNDNTRATTQRCLTLPHARSPMRPQYVRATPHSPRRPHEDQLEVVRLRAELASSKSEISSLRVELSQQQYELEEVNLIINLQDELRACKQVIHQQKQQVQQLILAEQEQQPTKTTENSHTSSTSPECSASAQQQSLPGQVATTASSTNEEFQDLKEDFQKLHARHSDLQNNRAWSEFQLRGRICNDSLRYHRRLIHWKSKNLKLEHDLVQIKAAHSTEIQELQTKWKSTASSVLQHTLKDLKNTQGKVRQLEKELTRVKLEQNQPEIHIQDSSSKFLVRAAKQSNFL